MMAEGSVATGVLAPLFSNFIEVTHPLQLSLGFLICERESSHNGFCICLLSGLHDLKCTERSVECLLFCYAADINTICTVLPYLSSAFTTVFVAG